MVNPKRTLAVELTDDQIQVILLALSHWEDVEQGKSSITAGQAGKRVERAARAAGWTWHWSGY